MKKKIIFAIALTIALIYFLISQIDINELKKFLASISPELILLCFPLYIFSMLLRTLRFQMLLKMIEFDKIFSIVCIYYLLINILPARTGELSYIYLLKKIKKIPLSEGIATLVITRILDFITVAVFFLISFYIISLSLSWFIQSVFLFVAFMLILLSFILFLLIYKGKKIILTIDRITKILKIKKFKIVKFLLEKLNGISESFGSIDKKSIFYSLVISFLLWFCIFFMMHLLTTGMNTNIGINKLIFVASFTILTTTLPIQGIAGFGTYEGAWTIAMLYVGVSKELAIMSGFGIHILNLIYSIMLSIFGFFRLKIVNFFRR
ncbi:MAG: lysylphosphatidylglycerol synthase transmembrane domain-containing protein [Candidatus Altiarchaeota archaeon]